MGSQQCWQAMRSPWLQHAGGWRSMRCTGAARPWPYLEPAPASLAALQLCHRTLGIFGDGKLHEPIALVLCLPFVLHEERLPHGPHVAKDLLQPCIVHLIADIAHKHRASIVISSLHGARQPSGGAAGVARLRAACHTRRACPQIFKRCICIPSVVEGSQLCQPSGSHPGASQVLSGAEGKSTPGRRKGDVVATDALIKARLMPRRLTLAYSITTERTARA